MTASGVKKNYVLLYKGIAIVRDTLLQFIKDCLQKAYGDEAWERGVKRVFLPEDIAKLEIQFNKRFANPTGPSRPGTDLFEILDINYFTNVIEGNWKQAFSGPLNGDKTILFYVNEIVQYRNPVAHPETGDLRDDDTFRGLDTGERILRLINKEAAAQIQGVKDEFRGFWVQQDAKLHSLALEEIGIDLSQGLVELGKRLPEIRDDTLLKEQFKSAKEALLACLEQEKLGPFSPSISQQKQKALSQLDQISFQVLGKGFIPASITTPSIPLYSPDEAAKKTHELRNEISDLKSDLVRLERQHRRDEVAGAGEPFTKREIDRTQKSLEERERQYEELEKRVFPPAFFEVERRLQPSVIKEENVFTVEVRIKNLGKQGTRVNYEDGFDIQHISVVDGSTSFTAQIESGEAKTFSYKCICTSEGSYQILTKQFAYAEKVAHWDTLKETKFDCQQAKNPHLIGLRYFCYTRPGEIEVIVRLNNGGDKIAHDLSFHQVIKAKGVHPRVLRFEGDMAVKEERVLSCKFRVDSPDQIEFPKSSVVTYFDNKSNQHTLTLQEPFQLLQYSFPSQTAIVGRDETIRQLGQVFENVKAGNSFPGSRTIKKVVFVDGPEGVGKSRLLEEFRLLSSQNDIACIQEDATSRTPATRILRQLIGLSPDETDRDLIWDALETKIPESGGIFKQRLLIVDFIASQLRGFSPIEIDRLQADIKLLISKLCAISPVFLIFENIQRLPEGIEFEVFKSLVSIAANYPDVPLIICASYRPASGTDIATRVLDQAAYNNYIKIQLGNLSTVHTNHLIDQLIPFPTMCQDLRNFVYEWSQGNPLYIREILRQITSVSKGMIRLIGNEWFPSKEFSPSGFQVEMSNLILENARGELGEDLQLLRLLAVIGLEFSWKLLSNVVFQIKDIKLVTETELLNKMANFERAGFIKTSLGAQELQYEFEHQAKREAIYNDPDFRIDLRTLYREKIVNVLLQSGQEIFPDKEEYNRQIARHLINASRQYVVQYRGIILLAAEQETRRRNFPRAVEYYSKLLLNLTDQQFLLEQANLYYQRGRIYKLQAKLDASHLDLIQAESLLAEARNHGFKKLESNELYSALLVEQASVLLLQKDTLKANELLWNAHIEYEGIFRQRRFFPPKSKKFFDGIIDVYLGLTEVWLLRPDSDSISIPTWRIPLLSFSGSVTETYRKRAEYYATKAYKTFLGDTSWLLRVYLSCAELYRRSASGKERYRSTEWLNQALSLIQKSSHESERDIYSQERVLTILAETYREQNLESMAQEFYEKARVIQEELQDYQGLGITYGGIGDILVSQGNFDSAQYYLEKAVEYQKLVGDTERYWRSCNSLVKIYIQHNLFDNAYSYWEICGSLVIGHVTLLNERQVDEVYSNLQTIAVHYKKQKNWQKCTRVYRDMLTLVNSDNQRAEIDIFLGEIYLKTNEMDSAIETLQNGLDIAMDPLAQAELHGLLGDACAATNENQSEALDHYKEGTKLYLSEKLNKQALDVYEKLLEKASAKEDDIPQVTDTLFSLVEVMLSRQKIDERFIEQAEKVLEVKQRFQEAGDLFVNAVRMVGGLGNEDFAIERRVALLKKAEGIYFKSKQPRVIMSGLNKLISAYFSLDQWEKVTEHFVLLLNLCADRNNSEEFVITFRSIVMLQEEFPSDNFETILEEAIKSIKEKKEFDLNNNKKASILISVAKGYHYLSEREHSEFEKYLDLALLYYEEAIGVEEDNSRRVIYLNDTAIIYEKRNNIPEAEKRLKESISIQDKDAFSLACRKCNLANLYSRTLRIQEANTLFEESLRVILGRNAYWDQRKDNENANPLSPEEIGLFAFEKNWAASACQNYGNFSLFVDRDISKAISYLNMGANIYLQIENRKAAEEIQSLLAQIQNQMPVSDRIHFQMQPTYQQYRSCPSCQGAIESNTIVCPQCGARSCPSCGNIQDGTDEYCEFCDHYLGSGPNIAGF